MKHSHLIPETENNDQKYPDWYWAKGLHDAQIVSVDELELPYDYKLRNPTRNVFVIRLDSAQALFDRSVKEIKLYNYKILTAGASSSDLLKVWWLSDSLIKENDKFYLSISLQRCGHKIEDFDFAIQFSFAEVTRK